MVDINNLDSEQINQLIYMLQKMLPDSKEENQSAKSKKTKPVKKKNTNPIRSKKLNSEEIRENKFLDMPERQMHKSDSVIDKKLNKFPPTPRGRSFQYIEVKCRLCGKSEKVSPKLLPESLERYKCNRCSSSEG